jgi:DNA-binding MarR family transcriptional regulator
MATEYLGKLDRSPTHLLHRAGQCAYEIFQMEVKGGDVTPRQIAVLMMVASHEGLSQTRLVELTGIDRSTLADIVRRLQRKGLLHRRRTREDARAYAVKLTEEGRQILKTATPISERVDQRILEALPETNRDKFLDDLSTIVETLQRLSPDVTTPE